MFASCLLKRKKKIIKKNVVFARKSGFLLFYFLLQNIPYKKNQTNKKKFGVTKEISKGELSLAWSVYLAVSFLLLIRSDLLGSGIVSCTRLSAAFSGVFLSKPGTSVWAGACKFGLPWVGLRCAKWASRLLKVFTFSSHKVKKARTRLNNIFH